MKRLALIIISIALFAPVLGSVNLARAAVDEGADILNACSGGRCGVDAGAGRLLTGAKGPTKTVRGLPAAENVDITNPYVGIASPVINAISAATAGTLGHELYKWAQEFVLETLKKRALDLMVDQIVNWIQGEGDPKFVTDWQGFLKEASDVALGELAVRVAGAGICEPFRESLLNNLRVPDPEQFSDGDLYGSSITCTLDEIVDNIEGFYEDFSNGGWAAYSESLKPQNDPVALLVFTQTAKFQTIASAQRAAELEALSGNGFLSTKTCFEKPNSDSPDLDGDKVKGDVASTCRITTPGATIGDLVGKAVGADIDYIVNAEQLAAYMAAIADALWNRLVEGGVSGLAGLSTDNAPEGGYISRNANDCESLGAPELISACVAYRNSNGNNLAATKDDLSNDIAFVRADLTELANALEAWKTVADELNEAVIAAMEEGGDTECIGEALEADFSNPTPAGVQALVDSISSQLATVNARIVELDNYQTELETLPENVSWSTFATLASTIQSKLSLFEVSESAVETVNVNTEELRTASLDIRQDIALCR